MPSANLTYELSLGLWWIVTNIFFREIRPRGAFNIPRDGPVIFVAAPHHNQFLDPLLLMLKAHQETRRTVHFLIAAKSLKRRFIGFLSGLTSPIPVARAADDAKPGLGRIYLSSDDACLILGEGTRFTTEFTPRMQIMLPKSLNSVVAEVTEVMSDTQLRIKREFGGESGKVTARIRERIQEQEEKGEKGLEFKRLPFVDQQDMYRHVYQCLKDGGCIGIFPEGGSHDRTDLLPLKAGVSIMALGAMADDPTVKVKIVPVGLSYFHAHRFRSRAVIEFGSAMDVPVELVEMFKEGGLQKRDAVAKLLDLVYDGLKTVTIRAPDYDTLMVIQAARRLYGHPGQHLSLGQVVELNKRFLEGYNHFQNEPRIQALRKKVLKYNRLVRDLGLRDHQVPRAQKAGWKTLGLLVYRLGLLAVWAVLALPGVILNGPIFLLASIISRQKAKEALAASNVKIAGRDVLATWKVLISLGAAPVLYGFYAFLATLVATKAGLPLKWRILTPVIVMSSLPFIGYAALKFGEAGIDVLKSLRPLIVALVPGQHKVLQRLKDMRAELSNELADVINTFGPQMYDDFAQYRMLGPTAKPPPSADPQGTGGTIDSVENLLVHPMTWLDERLFGWSRSARRGTSAWAGSSGTTSGDASRFGTPDVSDDEDEGDYDNVLRYLPTYARPGSPSQHKSRSRAGSYADLQKLRMTTKPGTRESSRLDPNRGAQHAEDSQPSSPVDGLHFRAAHRERKSSLTGTVPVEMIGHVDREEPFRDATDDLNREMKLHSE